MIKILLVNVIAVILFSTVANAEITIRSTNLEDHRLAATAVDSVSSYFKSLGYDVNNLDFSIVFADSVKVDTADIDDKNKGKRKVSGYYNAETREVNVYSFSQHRKDRTPWGLEWSKDIAYSILQHEIAHALIHHIKGDKLQDIDRVWNEYLAYAVQFMVMDETLRNRVINGAQKTDTYVDNPWVVNYMTYAANTDKFSIIVYNTIQRGKYLVKEVLETPPPTMTTEMFMRF